MPNWKSTGPNGEQELWIKNLPSVHTRISNQLDKGLQNEGLPTWVVTG